jgi:transposase
MGGPRRENWRYGHSIEWRSITIAIEHTTSAPIYVRSVLNIGTRRQTRTAGLYLREFAIRRVGLETLMFPCSS